MGARLSEAAQVHRWRRSRLSLGACWLREPGVPGIRHPLLGWPRSLPGRRSVEANPCSAGAPGFRGRAEARTPGCSSLDRR